MPSRLSVPTAASNDESQWDEADKDLAPYLYMNVRSRLKAVGLQSLYLDGRPRGQDASGLNVGFVAES